MTRTVVLEFAPVPGRGAAPKVGEDARDPIAACCDPLRFDYCTARMVRVLHLLPHAFDFETERGVGALSQGIGGEFSIARRTIGPGGDYRNYLLASLFMRKFIARDVDVVHAWGEYSRIAAISAGARRVVFSPTEFPTPGRLSRLTHALTLADVRVACSSQTLMDIYLSAGIPADRLSLIRPRVDRARIKPLRDTGLRRELGFSDGDYVLLAPGESTRAAGHRDALWAASILHVLDHSYKALLWGRGDQTLSCVRLAEKMHQPETLCVAEWKLGRKMEFEELLPAADAAIVAPGAPTPTLPLMLCMAAGLPIVATPTPLTKELLTGRQGAVFVERHAPRLLARSVIEARETGRAQSPPARSTGDLPAALFSSSQFVSEFRRLYKSMAR
jgi:glycosyltransferase involved in cell wall biosynthesis